MESAARRHQGLDMELESCLSTCVLGVVLMCFFLPLIFSCFPPLHCCHLLIQTACQPYFA